MALISVREYAKLYIGAFDPARPSVTAAQAELITDLKATYGFEAFRYVNGHTLAAQQYVGVFQFGPHAIEILPKVGGDDRSVRRNLVAMLMLALDLEVAEGEIAHVATQKHGILEILIGLFCDKLFAQVHRGLVRRYEPREENLPVLRGRLAVAEQLRRNVGNPERLFCRFDEFQEDNALNVVLKAAVRLLLGVAQTLENQRKLTELVLVFEGVADCHRSVLPWHRVAFDRLNDRYKACFKLAELFLKNEPPDVSSGKRVAFSLFFDMNTLFEEYIGRQAMRVFRRHGIAGTLQGPQKCVACDEDTGRDTFLMKPDVVGSRNGCAEWILDTKWKELSPDEARDGVAQSDLYQMYAYSSCYGCTDVVLLYPHHQSLGTVAGVRRTYSLNPWAKNPGVGEARRVRVATVDLADLATVAEQLERIIFGIDGKGASTRIANEGVTAATAFGRMDLAALANLPLLSDCIS
ncbi:McrC family protein [Paraburkholderia strydomiana]|uniref:McrC family protein n=1 Tax=Paraburkholderia strydomiana TaxID=1245417 RepID=UPI0038B9C9C1